jgi:diamine N-acetyltransferase
LGLAGKDRAQNFAHYNSLQKSQYICSKALGFKTPFTMNNTIKIKAATVEELRIVQAIAYQTWPITFGGILSKPQIAYMLDMMYSLDSLKSQVEEKKHCFLLASEEKSVLGFLSYELNYGKMAKTKIHKIYILPQAQGKGVGKSLIQSAIDAARKDKNSHLILNVNKYNLKAIRFYEKLGFYEAARENIPIGNGYLMEDVVMELKLEEG